MLHEPAPREFSILGRISAGAVIAIALVLLLHFLIVWLLLRASITAITPTKIFHEAPITLWLQKAPAKKTPPPPKPKKLPKKEAAPSVPHAVGPILPAPPSTAAPASEYNGLRALGRYLNNCSNLAYGNLSDRELAHCIGNLWGKAVEAPVTLGTEPPSEWKKQFEERKKPARKLEHECAQGSFKSNLGLPCYNFSH